VTTTQNNNLTTQQLHNTTTPQHNNFTTQRLNNMTNQSLESYAKTAGQSKSEYTKITLGIFEAKGTRGNRADTAARVAIWAEAIKLGIKGKEGLGADQWEQCINTQALRAVAPRINAYLKLSKDARLRSKDHNRYLALEEFTQEALRGRRSSRGDNND
jgi:hypothetical protein